MNLILALAWLFVPGAIKRQMLREWFKLTAQGFRVEPPELKHLNYQKLLQAYARFTADQAGRVLASDTLAAETKQRLLNLAQAYGRELRKQFKVKTMPEALRLGRLMYRLIGIELHAPSANRLAVTRCFFQSYYSPQVCGLMSALDEGVLTGLTDSHALEFTQRLTEGHRQCQAHLM